MAKIDLAGRLSDVRARVAAEVAPAEAPVPMFARLSRKDARVRGDQLTALAALADAVMRRRRFKAERITENTLIRVAIDLLLAHAEKLRGSTEDELRNSVTSALTDLGDPATSTATCDSTCGDNLTPRANPTPGLPQRETPGVPDSEPPGVVLAPRGALR
ncbi:hypothetical protein Q9R08_01210 [Microbacterium sp. QXD-8]|uniref:Uncharacterized protein n=1 Tax=Microbacterium psychrotolerans TaxID=3068321 RepID=A0ABU0YZ90_9MICO|nr:hypothetical protein [Microbacterium sp. QXD-8]MDQ7876586.1 hypothetical protein [Microbacterium sp. QXD-8]